jgi:hypothetical protein
MAAFSPSAGQRVGARHDEEAGIRAGVDRGLDAVTISPVPTISLPGRWPQRLALTWSSMCIAAAPALMSRRIVRPMLKAAAEAGVDIDHAGAGRRRR